MKLCCYTSRIRQNHISESIYFIAWFPQQDSLDFMLNLSYVFGKFLFAKRKQLFTTVKCCRQQHQAHQAPHHTSQNSVLSLSLLSLIKTTKSHHSAASPSGTYMHFQPGHLLRIYITKLRGSLAVSTGSLYNTQHYRLSRRAPLTHQHWTSPAGKGGVQH